METPQCHDVITAVGAEPFGPLGRLICHTETSSVGHCGQSAALKKCHVLLGCLNTTRGSESPNCMHLAEGKWFELTVT